MSSGHLVPAIPNASFAKLCFYTFVYVRNYKSLLPFLSRIVFRLNKWLLLSLLWGNFEDCHSIWIVKGKWKPVQAMWATRRAYLYWLLPRPACAWVTVGSVNVMGHLKLQNSWTGTVHQGPRGHMRVALHMETDHWDCQFWLAVALLSFQTVKVVFKHLRFKTRGDRDFMQLSSAK